jgi:hypothetical protein
MNSTPDRVNASYPLREFIPTAPAVVFHRNEASLGGLLWVRALNSTGLGAGAMAGVPSRADVIVFVTYTRTGGTKPD